MHWLESERFNGTPPSLKGLQHGVRYSAARDLGSIPAIGLYPSNAGWFRKTDRVLAVQCRYDTVCLMR